MGANRKIVYSLIDADVECPKLRPHNIMKQGFFWTLHIWPAFSKSLDFWGGRRGNETPSRDTASAQVQSSLQTQLLEERRPIILVHVGQ